ncbi:MAG: hypothetical protein WD294_14620 [Phycisphaeraceae bacterium]
MRMPWLIVLMVAMMGAISFADDVPEPPVVPDAEPAAEAPQEEADRKTDEQLIEAWQLDIRPQSIRYSSNMQFHGDGQEPTESQDAHLTISITYDGDAKLNLFSVDLTGKTNHGREIALAAQNVPNMHQPFGHVAPGNHDRLTQHVGLRFVPTVDRSMDVEGHITIRFPELDREAILKPFSKFDGKKVRIEGAGKPLVVEVMQEGDRLKVSGPAELAERLAEVRVYDDAGRLVNTSGRGSSTGGNRAEFFYHVRVPDDGALALDVLSDLREVRVPIKLERVRLPRLAPDDAGPDLAVVARPRDEGGVRRDLQPQKNADDAELRIELVE